MRRSVDSLSEHLAEINDLQPEEFRELARAGALLEVVEESPIPSLFAPPGKVELIYLVALVIVVLAFLWRLRQWIPEWIILTDLLP
jgi:hypothetical protein